MAKAYIDNMGGYTSQYRDSKTGTTTRYSMVSGSGQTHMMTKKTKTPKYTRYESTRYFGTEPRTTSVTINNRKSWQKKNRQMMDLLERSRGTSHEKRVRDMIGAYDSWKSSAAAAGSAG